MVSYGSISIAALHKAQVLIKAMVCLPRRMKSLCGFLLGNTDNGESSCENRCEAKGIIAIASSFKGESLPERGSVCCGPCC